MGAFLAVCFSPHDDVGGHEADNVKVIAEFLSRPDLTVLGLQCFPTARLGIDFCKTLTADGFGGVTQGSFSSGLMADCLTTGAVQFWGGEHGGLGSGVGMRPLESSVNLRPTSGDKKGCSLWPILAFPSETAPPGPL